MMWEPAFFLLSGFLLQAPAGSDNITGNEIIARCGDVSVTLNEFRVSYTDLLKKPRIFDSPTLREEVLTERLRVAILAKEAKYLKLDSSAAFQFDKETLRKFYSRAEFFNQQVTDKIIISEPEIEEAYQFTQEKRKIRHLFFETIEQADSAFRLLQAGLEFDSLAKNLFKDSQLSQSGGNLGWVEWDDLDYELAMAAFRTKPGFITKPVRSFFGYHILKVDDFQKKPLITRFEYEQKRMAAYSLLKQKRATHNSHQLVDSVLQSSEVIIFPAVIRKLNEFFSSSYARIINEKNVSDGDEEINNYVPDAQAGDLRNEVLADLNGQPFTVNQFYQIIRMYPRKAWEKGFKSVVDAALRDELIGRLAESQGFLANPLVQLKVSTRENDLLAGMLKPIILKNLSVSQKEMNSYFIANGISPDSPEAASLTGSISGFLMGEKKESQINQFVFSGKYCSKPEFQFKWLHQFYNDVIQRKVTTGALR